MPDLISRLNGALTKDLSVALRIDWKTDHKGVIIGWCRLPDSDLLLDVAGAIAMQGGRLSTVTAYLTERDRSQGRREIAYHFDLDGTTLTLTI